MNNTLLVCRGIDADVRIEVPFDGILPDGELFGMVTIDDLEHSVVSSTPLLRTRLEIVDAKVLMIEQVVRIDARPILLQTTYHRLDDENLSKRILAMNRAGRSVPFDDFFLQMFGVPRGKTEVSIEAVRCDERTAVMLGALECSPLLVREIVYFDALGAARAVGYSHFRADSVFLRQVMAGSPHSPHDH